MVVLVTGGAGSLGSKVAAGLVTAGHEVRAMSRRARARSSPGITPVRADLVTGEGVGDAVAGAEVIVHCASSPFRRTVRTDVHGTAGLLRIFERENSRDRHFLYISIVGVDRIPMGYYKAKLAAEELITASRVPWTIVRATQFHELADLFLGGLARLPVLPLFAGFRYQLVDAQECADHLVEQVARGASGRAPDIGGPEVLDLPDIADAWLAARGKRRLRVAMPLPGGFARSMRAGHNLAPQSRFGRKTWSQWLAEH